MVVRELMLELLTWAPFAKLISGEKEYIGEILSENYQQPQSMFHDLFLGFYCYVHKGDFKDVIWLRHWRDTYHQNENYTNSAKSERVYYPLLFKKICFYIIVHGNFSDEDFMDKEINLSHNLIGKWHISSQLRKFAEADTYSAIKVFRHGVKKPYIVSLVKKLYHEAGRQQKRSTTLGKLPRFVDVFAGTASVAASVVSEGCPRPIINDYDPVMVCFAWAFTYYQGELRKRIAEFYNGLMNQDIKSQNWSYDEKAYKEHHGTENLLTSPETWADPAANLKRKEKLGLSDDFIVESRMIAQCHQDFIIRIRSSYIDFKKVLDSCDRDNLREIDFNNLPTDMRHPQDNSDVKKVLDYALAWFYCHSFSGERIKGSIQDETIVKASSFYSFLNHLQPKYLSRLKGEDAIKLQLEYLFRLQVELKAIRNANCANKAQTLSELQLAPSLLGLEFTGHFSRYLRGATFCCEDFEAILKDNPSNKIFYLDSPYFLTVGYDVDFTDDDHKNMLGILRDAEFRWIFSMQYNASARNRCTKSSDEAERRKQSYIKDYGAYYRGFYAEFELDAAQKTYYVPVDAPKKKAEKLFVILFDFDEVQKKWSDMRGTRTREMLVVNFDCLATIPLHDTAVVLPFDEFLRCADDGIAYSEIVKRAIVWRKDSIEKNYAGKVPV